MANSTTTPSAPANTPQAPIFRKIPIECYTNSIFNSRETALPHPIVNVQRRTQSVRQRNFRRSRNGRLRQRDCSCPKLAGGYRRLHFITCLPARNPRNSGGNRLIHGRDRRCRAEPVGENAQVAPLLI